MIAGSEQKYGTSPVGWSDHRPSCRRRAVGTARTFRTACRHQGDLGRQLRFWRSLALRRQGSARRKLPRRRLHLPRTAETRAGEAGRSLYSCDAFGSVRVMAHILGHTTPCEPIYSKQPEVPPSGNERRGI